MAAPAAPAATPAVAPAGPAATSGPFSNGQKVKLVSLASNKAVSVTGVKPSVVAASGDDAWVVHVAADGSVRFSKVRPPKEGKKDKEGKEKKDKEGKEGKEKKEEKHKEVTDDKKDKQNHWLRHVPAKDKKEKEDKKKKDKEGKDKKDKKGEKHEEKPAAAPAPAAAAPAAPAAAAPAAAAFHIDADGAGGPHTIYLVEAKPDGAVALKSKAHNVYLSFAADGTAQHAATADAAPNTHFKVVNA